MSYDLRLFLSSPTFALKKIKAKNYKGIKEIVLELPKYPKWIFFTGENGSGKTTLLQGIALGLVEDTKTIDHRNIEFHPTNEKGTFDVKFKCLCETHETDFEEKFEKVCCYGSFRLDIENFEKRAEDSQIEHLFGIHQVLRNVNKEISRWYSKKDSDKDSNKKFATKYEKVTKLLIELLHLEKIEVNFDDDSVFYYEKDKLGGSYNKVTFYDLASGRRSIISMVGDMILRLFDTQPDVYDPAELSGIVIIDELDLHLHPKWQKRLPGLLSEIFPRVQFIASTHSPIPLLGAPEHSVFLKVNRDAEEGITVERLEDMEKQISNLLPNTILSSP